MKTGNPGCLFLRISHRTVFLRRQEGTKARPVRRVVLVYGAVAATMAVDGPLVLSRPAGLTL